MELQEAEGSPRSCPLLDCSVSPEAGVAAGPLCGHFLFGTSRSCARCSRVVVVWRPGRGRKMEGVTVGPHCCPRLASFTYGQPAGHCRWQV